jgi:hypothetical protein
MDRVAGVGCPIMVQAQSYYAAAARPDYPKEAPAVHARSAYTPNE